jgi:ABC-type lipoprotein export system ATPase subunit
MTLLLTGIGKRFHGPSAPVPVLDQVGLTLGAGTINAIRGASGSGKTTLLLIAGGLLRPDEGSVTLAGDDLYACTPGRRAAMRAAGIGFVFQQFHLLPYLSVLDNILVPALAADARALRPRARQLAERFGLAHRLAHRPAALSTGERQRVALARALLRQPRVVLADEPTGNLDPENASLVMTHLTEFAQAGGTVLLATHDPRAAAHASHRWRLENGRLAPDAATVATEPS